MTLDPRTFNVKTSEAVAAAMQAAAKRSQEMGEEFGKV
jgi:hypothetical protein